MGAVTWEMKVDALSQTDNKMRIHKMGLQTSGYCTKILTNGTLRDSFVGNWGRENKNEVQILKSWIIIWQLIWTSSSCSGDQEDSDSVMILKLEEGHLWHTADTVYMLVRLHCFLFFRPVVVVEPSGHSSPYQRSEAGTEEGREFKRQVTAVSSCMKSARKTSQNVWKRGDNTKFPLRGEDWSTPHMSGTIADCCSSIV